MKGSQGINTSNSYLGRNTGGKGFLVCKGAVEFQIVQVKRILTDIQGRTVLS